MKLIFKETELCDKIMDNYIIANRSLRDIEMNNKERLHQMNMLVENTIDLYTALKDLPFAMRMMNKADYIIQSMDMRCKKESHICPEDDNDSD